MPLFSHYADQLGELTSRVKPLAIKGAQLAYYNRALSEQLELPTYLQEEKSLMYALFSPTGELAQNSVAQKYGGHQFGQWNPRLGDGRGLLLGEHQDSKGQLWDLHLKGSGPTPYSRSGDGRAVLRSTIREFLASEALHALDIPTSRALCLISSQHPVQREQIEPAAMLIRVSQSHIRFGHFEYFHHSKQPDKLQDLFDFCFKHHFSHIEATSNKYYELLAQVVTDTAKMVARWQAYGFNHGVMNTDNMSIHGITFDYGPYAFMDDFQSDYICNHTDHSGRYAFDQQPGIALWNLNAFAHAFSDYLSVEEIVGALEQFEFTMLQHFYHLMADRLGLNLNEQANESAKEANNELSSEDTGELKTLIYDWLQQLNKEKRDYHISHRLLCEFDPESDNQVIKDHFIDQQWIEAWLSKYNNVCKKQALTDQERKKQMKQKNPVYVLRNSHAQKAIDDAHQGDFSTFEILLEALKSPFEEQERFQQFAKPPPDEQKGIALSCSS